jgi:hypothetical protein
MFFNLFGSPVLFYYKQKAIKREIKRAIFAGIPEDRLESFTMPREKAEQEKAGFVFIEPHEFTYQGKMYDVVRMVQVEDKLQYFCINDKDEERLIAEFGKKAREGKPISTPASTILISIFVAAEGITNLNYYGSDELIGVFEHNFSLLKGGSDPLVPPPRQFS